MNRTLLGIHIAGKALYYCAAVATAGVLMFQVRKWLQDGNWPPYPLTEALAALALRTCSTATAVAVFTSANSPSNWIGLHELAHATPTFAALIVLSFIGKLIADYGLISYRWADDSRRYKPNGERYADASMPATRLDGQTLSLVEQDLMRWLALNESDDHLNTQALMARYMPHSADQIHAAAASLDLRGLLYSRGGRLRLSAQGRSFHARAQLMCSSN